MISQSQNETMRIHVLRMQFISEGVQTEINENASARQNTQVDAH